jgi:hypothetical protein
MSVIVRLSGGLGNQMFQYAAASGITAARADELVLDLRSFDDDRLRSFELHRWRVQARVASRAELKPYSRIASGIFRRMAKAGIRTRYYLEQSLDFDPSLADMTVVGYLDGYFQCARYFEHIRDRLLREFVPLSPLTAYNSELLEVARAARSVSIHVRRGDYVTVQTNVLKHGACGLDYYRAAVARVMRVTEDPLWLVFSDDLEWTRKNLQLPGEVRYVDNNQDAPEVDIYLMSQCAHNICANSSFSWWGAWLNSSKEKTVTAPAAWFASDLVSSRDLVPLDWVRL